MAGDYYVLFVVCVEDRDRIYAGEARVDVGTNVGLITPCRGADWFATRSVGEKERLCVRECVAKSNSKMRNSDLEKVFGAYSATTMWCLDVSTCKSQ